MPWHRLMSDDDQRIEIITGTARRRRWTTAEKLRIVEEPLHSGESLSAVARRNGVAPYPGAWTETPTMSTGRSGPRPPRHPRGRDIAGTLSPAGNNVVPQPSRLTASGLRPCRTPPQAVRPEMIWWSRRESNPRPLECDSSALPTELRPHPSHRDRRGDRRPEEIRDIGRPAPSCQPGSRAPLARHRHAL